MALTTIAIVTLALLMGITGTTYQAIRANQARQLAERRRVLADERLIAEQQARREAEEANSRAEDRANLALRLITSMYEDIDWLTDAPGLEDVRQSYVERALTLFEQLEEEKMRWRAHATWTVVIEWI